MRKFSCAKHLNSVAQRQANPSSLTANVLLCGPNLNLSFLTSV